MYKKVITVLELIVKHCHDSIRSQVLFYDELANLMKLSQLSPPVQEWIAENIASLFTTYFVVSAVDVDTTQFPISMDINGETSSIAMKLMSTEVQPLQPSQPSTPGGAGGSSSSSAVVPKREAVAFGSSPLHLICPLFNLLQISSRKQHSEGSLEDIDALLGCGMALFDLDNTDLGDLEYQERKERAFTLFHTINWLREALNAFATEPYEETRAKCVHRIQDLIRLEKVLTVYLEHIPDMQLSDFVLGDVSFQSDRNQNTDKAFQILLPQAAASDDENEDPNKVRFVKRGM